MVEVSALMADALTFITGSALTATGGTGERPAKTGLAQLVEHWSPKPGVGSSSLSTRAKYDNTHLQWSTISKSLITN